MYLLNYYREKFGKRLYVADEFNAYGRHTKKYDEKIKDVFIKKLPDELIENIFSFTIKKIPQDDKRYTMLQKMFTNTNIITNGNCIPGKYSSSFITICFDHFTLKKLVIDDFITVSASNDSTTFVSYGFTNIITDDTKIVVMYNPPIYS